MKASNVTPQQIEQAAADVGVKVCTLRPEGNGSRFTLRTLGVPVRKYGRLTQYGKRAPGILCWHGHRDFMRALYALAPTMRLVTALATYTDAQHFERTYRQTGEGQRMGYTMDVRSDCDCYHPVMHSTTQAVENE